MGKIKVNPGDLLSKSTDIQKISAELQNISQTIQNAASSAPSYDGQFGPKVQAICRDAVNSAGTRIADLNTKSNDLTSRANKFSAADLSGRFNGLSASMLELLKNTKNPLLLSAINLGLDWDAIIKWIGSEHHGKKGWWNYNGTTSKLPELWNHVKTGNGKKIAENIFGLDEIKWSGLGIFTWNSDDYSRHTMKNSGDTWTHIDKKGWQFKENDSKTTWENVREKFLKWDIPLFDGSASVYKIEGSPIKERKDADGNVVSRGKGSVEVGKVSWSGKATIGGEDWFSAEIGAEATLASGKYTHVWGKDDAVVQGYVDGQVDFMKGSAKASISKDGVEAKLGFSVVDASVSGGANIGDYHVGVKATARVGWEWGFSAKKGNVEVSLGPFSFGLDIGKKITV